MKSAQLYTLLQNYIPASEEIETKKQMLNFITKNSEDCFDRNFFNDGHITASSWLLSKDHSRALLMHHTKLNMWVQLGGHCDGDSDTAAVALKEAREESGIHGISLLSNTIFDIDIHQIPGNSKEPVHFHYDVRFLLHVTTEERIIRNDESNELRWISKDPSTLPTNSRSVVRLFEKWIKFADEEITSIHKNHRQLIV